MSGTSLKDLQVDGGRLRVSLESSSHTRLLCLEEQIHEVLGFGAPDDALPRSEMGSSAGGGS